MLRRRYQVVVIGGGHAGLEAAWSAANLLGETGSVALVTLDPAKIGVMSCNPAIGGLAKGQLVREVDALGGLMGLIADATGIQFRLLNTSKGPAVHGPRCQSDKLGYAATARAMIAARPEIEVIGGAVEQIVTRKGAVCAVGIRTGDGELRLEAPAIVLTTGTFMRGLMHTGEQRVPGGRRGEAAASAISDELRRLGFELGRLKTGTPPRLRRASLDWESLPPQWGDPRPQPFSDLTGSSAAGAAGLCEPFPALEQVECRQTHTTPHIHELIGRNLHRAPMYSGQIESAGPRYCPSIEDKVVRFAHRDSHGVFLEPESLATDWIYCNGISTSLPADVQEAIVRAMPGCQRAEILQLGYAVEYDMVRPHQITATGMTKLVDGLFLAGQINGTSGYEEAAAQGAVAGINAARVARAAEPVTLGRHEAYIGVLMDDLVTRTPVEPYRMFTSRAEHRLLLRADNAAERLTPVAEALGLLDSTDLGRTRIGLARERRRALEALDRWIDRARVDGVPLDKAMRRPGFGADDLRRLLRSEPELAAAPAPVLNTALANRQYAPMIERQQAEIRRQQELERRRLPRTIRYDVLAGLRAEAAEALGRFRPETFGQAARLEGVTPADLTLLAVLVGRAGGAGAPASEAAEPAA
ncbi:MAG: tRNA uridine-5-carboxymethylaminomethyl(34) synthesis enzyme MnmG [Phycisphaerales bacterium JB039]